MTANTLSRLPVLAGGVVAAHLSRAGSWTLSQYMKAPLASTALLGMVTLTAMAASNALYFQTQPHPQPMFGRAADVPVAQVVSAPAPMAAPVRDDLPTQQLVSNQTTGSVTPAQVVIPDQPVGNADAFAVQKRLAELGLFSGKVDGFYGPMTASAIRAFESRNGLTPTGALTRDIVDAILRSNGSGVAAPMPQAAVQPAPQPVVQQVAVAPTPAAAPAPVAVVQQQPQPQSVHYVTPQPDPVVARLPDLNPVSQAVDTVGSAAASTIDSIVAVIDTRSASQPAMQALRPIQPSQPVPEPLQVASLEPVNLPQPTPVQVQAQPVPPVAVAVAPTKPVVAADPANNKELVSSIQRGLASLGFYQGKIDGHPGDGTARAIREFENFHSYGQTGKVSADLVGLLRQAGASI